MTTQHCNQPQTKEICALCGETHPASEGITHYRNVYECDGCGQYWEDTWCCGCDDECSNCGADISPTESEEIEVVEEAA